MRERVNDSAQAAEASERRNASSNVFYLTAHGNDRRSREIGISTLACYSTQMGQKQRDARKTVVKINSDRRQSPMSLRMFLSVKSQPQPERVVVATISHHFQPVADIARRLNQERLRDRLSSGQR